MLKAFVYVACIPPLHAKIDRCMAGMQADMRSLVTASTFAVIVTALENHVREAARRGWGTATQLSRGDCRM